MDIPKSSPIPWSSHYSYGYLIVESECETLHIKVSYGIGTSQDMANAKLIAASPYLLDALNNLVNLIEKDSPKAVSLPEIQAAKAAIAKTKC